PRRHQPSSILLMSAVAEGDLRVVNPATLELVATVPATPPEAVQEIVAEARLAQERWGETPLAERRALMLAAADVLLDSMDEIADTVVAETAKPLVEAFTTELLIAAESLVWLAREAPRVLAPERVRFGRVHLLHKRARLVYEPRGVIGL